MGINKKWIVNCYNKDFSWIKNYTRNYIIYDKSCTLEENERVVHQKNVGYNIYDYMNYIVENYDNLPGVCVFLKANAFKHCKKETFDKLIIHPFFTPIEDYSHVPESAWHKKAPDGGYMELNNSWYITSHKQTYGSEVNKYIFNYNDLLDELFENPEHPLWIRFAPGGQYIVKKQNLLYYSKNFYEKLVGLVDYHQIPAEAHIIERMLYYIFTNKWKEAT